MPANSVRSIFLARIKQLMAQYEESKAVEHDSTVGAMREEYLRSFLRELLPPKFSPVSGFIADMDGHITPQLDMIFIDRSELPIVSLVGDTAIVPFEIALLTAEIKSTLKSEHLNQIRKQQASIKDMSCRFLMGAKAQEDIQDRRRRNIIGTMVIAFELDIGEKTLEDFMKSELGGPSGICVLRPGNKKILTTIDQIITGPKRLVQTHTASDPCDYEPLLTFVAAAYRWLHYLQLWNSTMSDAELEKHWNSHATWFWEGYLSKFISGD